MELDEPLPFSIIIDDMNDNPPTFTGPLQVTVLEHSKAGEEDEAGERRANKFLTRLTAAGTVVGMLNATDRDQPDTPHVKIRYTLLDNLDRFSIHPHTGVITTVTDGLDREVRFSEVKSNHFLLLTLTVSLCLTLDKR